MIEPLGNKELNAFFRSCHPIYNWNRRLLLSRSGKDKPHILGVMDPNFLAVFLLLTFSIPMAEHEPANKPGE